MNILTADLIYMRFTFNIPNNTKQFYITTKNRKLSDVQPIYKNKFTNLINKMKKSRLNYKF
jgi:hypothetical protein